MTPPQTDRPDQKVLIFLSWSGEKSKLVAQALKENLEDFSGRVDAWLSEDLTPGVQWAKSLMEQIGKSDLAIINITSRNITAPWISFEAGAYFTSPRQKGVIPYLIDLKSDELTFPLGLFQGVGADWQGTKGLFGRVAELVGADEFRDQSWEFKFTRDIWPSLEDRIDTIKTIDVDGKRTEEPGNWMNIANAFYLGHDLRWTIDAIERGNSREDIRHGLKQVFHQADELGLSQRDDFLILALRTKQAMSLDPTEWDDAIIADLKESLQQAFQSFGGILIRRQPGYRSYPPENQEKWLQMQAEGRA